MTYGAHVAYAQIPSTADSSRQTLESDILPARPDLSEPEVLESRPPALAPEMSLIRFQLNSLKVRGASAFSPDQLAEFYQDQLEQDISVANLFQILADIQQLYLDEGFSLSKVSMPEQNIQDGNIIFEVVEGYIGGVEVGEGLPDVPMVDDFVSEVLAMKPLNVKKLERMMLIMNDRPSVNVTSVLSNLESSEEAGAVKLSLQDTRDDKDLNPVMGSIAINNYGSVFAGSGQIEGAMTLKNAGINLSDVRVQARATTSLPELQQVSFDYNQPVFGISGTTVSVSGAMSFTEPGSSLDELDVIGRFRSVSFSVDYPLIRQRDENLLFNTSFTYRNSETDLLQTEIVNDRLRVLETRLDYSKADQWRGLNFLGIAFAKGLNLMNASKKNDADLSRQDGDAQFHKITANYTRLQSLPDNFSMSFSMSGQYTPNPLLSSEEFGFGGMSFGRGYDPSEVTGDCGIAASLELRYDKPFPQHNLNLQPFLFYDIGKVWNIDPNAKDKISAASAGAGFMLRHQEGWFFDATFAKPLTLNASSPPKYTDEDGFRVLMRLTKEF